jgi:ABC-type branched-subunit amino acid transport system ATPase component
MLLELDKVTAGYGQAPILRNVSIQVAQGEIVCIIGPNGAGKSTVLRVIAGQLTPEAGRVLLNGESIVDLDMAARGRQGLIFIPQGSNIFPNLTVTENLEIAGALIGDRQLLARRIASVMETFPMLGEKRRCFGRELSGGERQLLALSRIRLLQPALVLLDEPSLGLAPLVVDAIFDEIVALTQLGASVLLVEQNARKGLSVSHRGYVLELGENRLTGSGRQLIDNPDVQRLYLGG